MSVIAPSGLLTPLSADLSVRKPSRAGISLYPQYVAQHPVLVPCSLNICRMIEEWINYIDLLPTPPLKKASG